MSQKYLDLGCGFKKGEGYIGIDSIEGSSADIIHDLNIFPYPFEDNYFDKIVCNNSFEHFDNVFDVLEELHRISKDGALIHIESPHFSSCDFFTDPTHKHPFTSRSFDYVAEGTELFNFHYRNYRVKKENVRIEFANSLLDKTYGKYINASSSRQLFFERHFAFIIPANQIFFDLIVVKDKK